MTPTPSLYIFGAGTNGAQCAATCRKHGITVLAFLDNYTDKYDFCGAPVLRPAEADRRQTVVVTSPVYAIEIMLQLDWMDFGRVLNLSQFYHELGIEPDWAGDLQRNRPEYDWLRARLGDHHSHAVFDAVMRFRRTLDTACLAATRTDLRHQWFDREFFPAGPHVYVDGGAYDGDTAEAFIAACPEYRALHLYEPCAGLAAAARQRLSGHRSVRVNNAGLSDRMVQTRLHDAGLPSGHVGIDGEKVSLVALDEDLDQHPTFIKLDVEGCEREAVLGAAGHIRNGRPFLAVAVYHRPDDIWRIPRLLDGMQDYRFFLRHYTQFYHETVLYAL